MDLTLSCRPKVARPASGQAGAETQVGLMESLCSLNESSWDEGLNPMTLQGPPGATIQGLDHENAVREETSTEQDPAANGLLLLFYS